MQTAARAGRVSDADVAQSARLGDESDAAPRACRHCAAARPDTDRRCCLRLSRRSRAAAVGIACTRDDGLRVESLEERRDGFACRLYLRAARMDSETRTHDQGDDMEHAGDDDG